MSADARREFNYLEFAVGMSTIRAIQSSNLQFANSPEKEAEGIRRREISGVGVVCAKENLFGAVQQSETAVSYGGTKQDGIMTMFVCFCFWVLRTADRTPPPALVSVYAIP